MTNREYLKTLNNEDFFVAINDKLLFLQAKYMTTELDVFDMQDMIEIDFLSWLETEYKE